jgi:hypothetical protein
MNLLKNIFGWVSAFISLFPILLLFIVAIIIAIIFGLTLLVLDFFANTDLSSDFNVFIHSVTCKAEDEVKKLDEEEKVLEEKLRKMDEHDTENKN